MIDGKELKRIGKRELRRTALRVRLAIMSFAVVISFLLALGVLAYAAEKLGLLEKQFPNPIVAIWVIACLCSVMSITVSFYLMRRFFKPLEELSKASLKVAEGDFTVQLPYDGHLSELDNTIQNFNRMVRELNSVEIMRNDFVADVSHEFKTPLSAITGYAMLLQDPDSSQQEKDEYIHKIFFNIDKLNELTENILRLSKLEHQQFMEDPVCYRLDEQIREAIVLLEPKWGPKNMNLDLQLQEVNYEGQRGLLFQVWMNLIGNAVKYTDMNGNIQIILSERSASYEIIISDDGVGMSEETTKHIFDKFYQGDTSRKAHGNGLGLSLCKEIVNKCGGKIIVESAEGVGSVFMVQLPKEVSLKN